MTMMISKFHRLIQSKLLWAGFLIVVVFSFVIWGTQVPEQNRQAAEANAPGKLNGKPVDPAMFRAAYMNTYLAVIMAVGRPINITPDIDEQISLAAWQRIVTIDEAKKMGLTVNDDEVFEAIRSHEGFQAEGQFNKGYYKSFVNNYLAQIGFTERQFESYIRQEILMQKMRILVNRSVLVAPADIQRMFHSVSDTFKIEYVKLTPKLVEQDINVTREDARTFFEKDPAAFTIPDMVKVKYVRLSTIPLIPKVHVTPEDVQTYYDDHMDEYLADTNETADATNDTEIAEASEDKEAGETDAATNDTSIAEATEDTETDVTTATGTTEVASVDTPADDAGATNENVTMIFTGATDIAADTYDGFAPVKVDSKYKPFDDVKQEISNMLIRQAALEMASDTALEFVVALTSDKDGNAPQFEDVAEKNGFLIERAGPFALRENLEDIDAGLDFNRAAFNLTTGQDAYFSDPVKGSNYVYVIALEERIPARVPTFADVADEVLPIAREQAIADALSTKSREIRDAADTAVKEGKTFADALQAYGLEPITTEEFTASSGATDDDYSPILLRGILTMNPGEVSELLPAHDAVLVAHIIERQPGDPTTMESLKEQIISSIRRQNGRYVFDDMQQYLLKQAKFEPREIPRDTGDEPEEEDIPAEEPAAADSAG
ncbi:MAG: SurA N-terminal domain-containing protein [bacterium]